MLSPFVYSVEVQFADLDAIGHVNNAVYLRYVESARIAYWLRAVGRPADLSAINVIQARTEIDYRSPAEFGETLEVATRCLSMRRSSFVLAFEIRDRASGRLVAEGRNVMVYYDYPTQRPKTIPEDIRQRIRAADPDVREET